MTADSDFIYAEVAVGSVHNRNQVVPKSEFHPEGQVDCYASVFQFPVDLVDWLATHRNKKGRPTVAGYDGLALATFLPIDLDDEENPARAVEMAATATFHLRDQYSVPIEHVGLFYSGAKGVHFEIPSYLFGGFEPSEDIATYLKRLAELLLPPALGVDFDRAIYEILRLWRWPNTRHSKTGLYKVPLSATEIDTLTLEEIRMLAKAPREVQHLDTPASVIPALYELWQEAKQPIRPTSLRVKKATGVRHATVRIREGERNRALTSLAGNLRRLGLSEAAMAGALLVHNAEQCIPPLPESEVLGIAASVARYPVPSRRMNLGKSSGLIVREINHARS